MNNFKFDGLPSTSSVSAACTFAVSAWFFVAAGLALTDNAVDTPASQAVATQTRVVYSAPAVVINPEARLVIVVEGHRV